VSPVPGEDAPKVHAIEPRAEGAHAGVGALVEIRASGVHLDAVHAHVLPAAVVVVTAAAEPHVLILAGLACDGDDQAAVGRIDRGAERRLQGTAPAQARSDGGGDLGRVANGHVRHGGSHYEGGKAASEPRVEYEAPPTADKFTSDHTIPELIEAWYPGCQTH